MSKLPIPEKGVVEVWQISIGEIVGRDEVQSAKEFSTLRSLRRADDVVGRKYAATDAVTRGILSRYLGLPPRYFDIVRDPCPMCGEAHGKPRLDGHSLEFSLSRSNEQALLAVCAEAVGVDIEWSGARIDPEHVAPAVLTAPELVSMYASNPRGRIERFLELWTKKEAVTKLLGLGLTKDLRDICISSDGSYAYVSTPGFVVERFALAELHVPGYAAAVATAEGPLKVRMREWRDR